MKILGSLRGCGLSMIATLLLQACGGGGGAGDPPAPPRTNPPTGLAYPTPAAFTLGTAIAALTPTVTGSVTAYSISPSLPAGLTINTSTGVISGTPTILQPATTFQVTASNTTGLVVAPITLTINDVAPGISYPKSAYTLTTGVPTVAISPSATGGAVVTWSIDHPLPAGLTFDTSNGRIVGAPTEVGADSNYLISAQNSGGTATSTLSIGVQSGVLLDLGHGSGIVRIVHSGSRMMSEDDERTAVLWNTQSRAMIARVEGCAFNPTPFCVNLAGPTAVFATSNGFDVRAASDGSRLTMIPFTPVYWWTLGPDGSYICAGSSSALTCWATNGTQLFTRSGDYRNAKVFAAPGELRVAEGAAGNQVIEKLAIPSGTSSVSAIFPGAFHSWFGDGGHFLTTAGNTITVNNPDAAASQADLKTLPSLEGLGGQNDWFYTAGNGTFNLYRVGASTNVEVSYTYVNNSRIVPSGNAIGILSDPVKVVDLSGAAPAILTFGSPLGNPVSFGANDPNHWAIGADSGLLTSELTGSSPSFTLGRVLSIGGSPTHAAVATASGVVFLFNAQTRAIEDQLEPMYPGQLEFSDDGSRLAVGPNAGPIASDRSVRVYSLPSKTVLAEWPSDSQEVDRITDFTFSGDGTVVGLRRLNGATVVNLSGTTIWSSPSASPQPLRLSTNGMKLAIASGGPDYRIHTDVYVNGVLSTALAAAYSVGWLDDTQLLVNRYVQADRVLYAFNGCSIVDSGGQTLSMPAMPEILTMQRLTSTTVYSALLNQILDVPTGDTLWSSSFPSQQLGAVAGEFVVFKPAGPYVRSEPR